MIPIKDINRSRSFPIVNTFLILLCAAVWLYQVGLDEYQENIFIYKYGLVPADVFQRPYTLLTHMFLHGSWLHIIGNMWFLWIFGDNVEDRLGRFRYLLFYIISGLGAALLQTSVSFMFGGEDVPMVGASGAISGVLGAYLRLFPHARILALVPIFFFLTFMEVPALFFIGLWILIQVINGILTLPFAQTGGVAWFAHIGGFAVGYTLVKAFYNKRW
ncbi:MAG: rhomboid family intramembrane serine protease [Hydrogenobacter thermophilus]|uniref:rhomboid family intramembrane serine protease n=1 Tax=Hydrogenobacter thermophilus TaxID=940 RepID=UPI000CB1B0F7|nr:rhomboid family intramembrane serine protease [Hydrogenobacter thermophilus]QWK20040.1 MAG: rhomboid family intramembrane serine protease [Hydrogenobacter thermophilus]GBC88610.1 Rhomboid protease AarA [bacterium HR13]